MKVTHHHVTIMALCAVLLATALPASAGDVAAGKARVGQCATCHGADGIAKMPDAPNLAGQNEAYLVKSLQDYRSGARQHEVMSVMAKGLSERDIADLAAYYSSIAITVKAP